MFSPTRMIALLAAPLALAACDGNQDTDRMSQDMPMSDDTVMPGEMPMIDGAMSSQTAEASGVVTAIDNDAGTVTIDHGPVASLGWPAMDMGFAASEEQRASVAEGDRVGFTTQQKDGGYEILSMTKE